MKKIYGYIFVFFMTLFLFNFEVKAEADSVTCDYGDFKMIYNKIENKVSYDYNSNKIAITDIIKYVNKSNLSSLFINGNTLTCPSLSCSSGYKPALGWTVYTIDEKANPNACTLKDKHINDGSSGGGTKDEKIICNYGVFIVTYHKAGDSYTFSNYNTKTQDISSMKKYLMKKINYKSKFINSDGKLYCPEIKCYKTEHVDAASGSKDKIKKYLPFEDDSHANLCTLNGSGDNSADMDVDVSGKTDSDANINNGVITFPTFNFGELGQSCKEFFGESGVKLIRTARKAIQMGATVLTLVLGMIMFIPAIMNKDNEGLSKSLSKFSKLLIILAIILLLPTFVKVIGMIAGFDITCL